MSTSTSSVIEVNELTKHFGSKCALDKVSFTIDQGHTIALVGPNGAGKTTLFSILCGFLRADSGAVRVLGHTPGDSSLFGILSALPQDAQLDPRFSVGKQLTFYGQLQGLSRAQAQQETARVLEQVDLSNQINAKASELSHGMRKRICIAQALIGKPRIVLLDEATAGLDPINAKAIRTLVADLSKDMTFILSSHDLSELERLCDTVLYLEQGKLTSHQRYGQNGSDTAYLTLQVKQPDSQMQLHIARLDGVKHVRQSQPDEFVIEYDTHQVALDIALLKLCHHHGWVYKQLINGNTLENQLFATP
ncbi:ABC transporter ATP-binding protein [Pseudoalteromonas rubra]|uniref:ABC transporter ATP-binding protein n=1 Tax=Pseudoalteromonas rubra TaxID=43658 RepID=A0A5S3WK77_9GAMM|nr:ABC transporter ATP-binding protein [Pseudoalteromonas rubra]TMP27854.1 ABC transporter ATP-binding protein [Pseudoalteromonas rubra]TMP31185.1 ABC transporter ATP-binding protein [Pseudoalteromonas rubra]